MKINEYNIFMGTCYIGMAIGISALIAAVLTWLASIL